MEDGVVTISRASGSLTFPAKFILIASQNPCPCGYNKNPKKTCVCSPGAIARYEKRVSGPILDRIDLQVSVPDVDIEKLTDENFTADPSSVVRAKVQKARDIQNKRFAGRKITCNAEMGPRDIKKYCPLDKASKDMLLMALKQMSLSARSYNKAIKIARTIADLDGSKDINSNHVSEALQFRFKDN